MEKLAKDKVISALDDVIQFLVDSKACFEKHVDNAANSELKRLFKQIATSRQYMIEEIKQELIRLGSAVKLKGTMLGKSHMVFENLKAWLTDGDPMAITKEVRRGENILIDYYKKAIKTTDDETLKKILFRHIAKIEDDIKRSDLHST